MYTQVDMTSELGLYRVTKGVSSAQQEACEALEICQKCCNMVFFIRDMTIVTLEELENQNSVPVHVSYIETVYIVLTLWGVATRILVRLARGNPTSRPCRKSQHRKP